VRLRAKRLVHARREKAAFQAGGAEHGLLAYGHALEGEQFLGIDGLVGSDQVGAKACDFVDIFEAHNGEFGGGETMACGRFGKNGPCPWRWLVR